MKFRIIFILLLTASITGCGPTQKITGSWNDPQATSMGPYNKIFIMVISQNHVANYDIEDQMAKTLIAKGFRVIRSTDIFPPKFSLSESYTRESLAETIKKNGCDAVLTLALLDTKKVETYHPGAAYYPYNYGYYGSYYSYYNYYSPMVNSPSYYTTDKTFYLETNAYDVASDKMIWSVQSEAQNPNSVKDWFKSYSYMLIGHLKSKGLAKKF